MRGAGALGRRGADERGDPVRFDGVIHVPEDEICFYVFGAASSQEAALAARLAALDPVRVVEAVTSGEEQRCTSYSNRRLRRPSCSRHGAACAPAAGAGRHGHAVELERDERADGHGGAAAPASVPHMAMVHGAVYDAVNAIDGGHEGYLLTSRLARPVDSKDAAAAAAAYRVLSSIVPAQQATLDAQYAASLAHDPGRLAEDARDRSRRGGGGGDDRGADGRRPLRAVPVPRRHGAGRLAAGAARVRQRSRTRG